MSTPFIRNHQYNVIKKQTEFLQNALRTVADRRVLGTVRFRAATIVTDAFEPLTEDQRQLLEQIQTLESGYDFQRYLEALEPYLVPYPPITPKQIQKLFPKNKKMKMPDLAGIDFRYTTYLGWVDIALNKLFIVYPHEGVFAGIEGRITPTHKKGYCLFCNRHQELAFFLVKTKNATPDNFSTIGQYVCIDNHKCNQVISDTATLEKFITSFRK